MGSRYDLAKAPATPAEREEYFENFEEFDKYRKPPSRMLAPIKYRMQCDKKYIGKSTSYTIENVRYTWIVLDTRTGKVLCESSDSNFTGGTKYWIHFPIEWNDFSECEKWIKEGCIGEIQERCQNLQVGFQGKFLKLEN